jgi:hypothetical protein
MFQVFLLPFFCPGIAAFSANGSNKLVNICQKHQTTTVKFFFFCFRLFFSSQKSIQLKKRQTVEFDGKQAYFCFDTGFTLCASYQKNSLRLNMKYEFEVCEARSGNSLFISVRRCTKLNWFDELCILLSPSFQQEKCKRRIRLEAFLWRILKGI